MDMKIAAENYCFYRLYVIDLDSVKHTLRTLKRYKRNDVRYSLLRDIIVGYIRPFSGNRGRLIRKHSLSMKDVPPEVRVLHQKMLDSRMQLLAHTDYTVHNPGFYNFGSVVQPLYWLVFKAVAYDYFDRKVKDIEKMVNAVESALQEKIKKMESMLSRLPV